MTFAPVKLSCSGTTTKSKFLRDTLGFCTCIFIILFLNLFFKYIDGITLFLPHEITILKLSLSKLFLKTKFLAGVIFGGKKFQKLLSSIFSCIKS